MSSSRLIAIAFLAHFLGSSPLPAQDDIGYIETFALASDRSEALGELIPGTDDYFYYHCVHHQNEEELADAAATIENWRVRHPKSVRLKIMAMRQSLLEYGQKPGPAIELVRRELNLRTNHTPPRRDAAAILPSKLDNSKLEWKGLLSNAMQRDRSLASIASGGLPSLVEQDLSDEQLRQLVGRLERADVPGTLDLIARELTLKGSRGFGWAPVHHLLTLEQLETLCGRISSLLGNDAFLREYLPRLLPRNGEPVDRPETLLAYLVRLKAFTDRLPQSQYNLKALVVGNLLKAQASQGVMDKQLFLEYLSLPSKASFYNPKLLRDVTYRVDNSFQLSPQVALSPIGDDSLLVRQYLEYFLKDSESTADFDATIESGYLARVFAETKILHGLGDTEKWYSMLSPEQQKAVRDRVELQFTATNQTQYEASDAVSFEIQCKNVREVVVKVYQIQLRNYYRSSSEEVTTAIDLDGLVPNISRTLKFSQPADRRHLASVQLPELAGEGVWVVDLLGGGMRSRALVCKGGLTAVERMSDAGQQFAVFNRAGELLRSATIELGNNVYQANPEGWITLPPAEKSLTRKMLLVSGDFVQQHTFVHAGERYELHASFVVDRESLVSGSEAAVVIASRLTCNGRPVAIELIEDLSLSVRATNLDGVSTSQTIRDGKLSDTQEWLYQFSVPSRLAELEFELRGKVVRAADDVKQTVQSSGSIQCNAIHRTEQIYDVFLRQQPAGYSLLVSGRNGEPAQVLPVVVKAAHPWLRDPVEFKLATDQDGVVSLGKLAGIASITVQSDQFQETSFTISKAERSWPGTIQTVADRPLVFALGDDAAEFGLFTLLEMRSKHVFKDWSDAIVVRDGAVRVAGLPAGDFQLRDWESGGTVLVRVESGRVSDSHVLGGGRALEVTPEASVVIRSVAEQGGKLRIEVEGADGATRVHVCVSSFAPDRDRHRQFKLPLPDPAWIGLRLPRSYYVDSLRLDEEYSYILNRRGEVKYPGNMLVQPSLLIHPWEIAKTSNLRRDAKAGQMVPNAAPAGRTAEGEDASADSMLMTLQVGWKSYEHLAAPSFWICNVEVKDGVAEIPLEQLKGYGQVSVFAAHPSSSDVRHMPLSDSNVEFSDQRLRAAFEANVALGQSETVQRLKSGELVELGGSYAQRFQAYDSLASVFQLYSTLLDDGQFAEFSFIANWLQLNETEKRARYSKHACHELNLFLYRRDPDFFKRVVRPFVAQKVEKQFVDLWLLEEPLDQYLELHQYAELNTLERVLLSKRSDAARMRTLRWMRDKLDAFPMDPMARQKLFDVALLGVALSVENKLGFETEESLARPQLSAGRAIRSRAMGGGGYADFEDGGESLFGIQRKSSRGRQLFESLPETKKWAETHYYRVPLDEQSVELIRPSPFWLEVLEHSEGSLLPTNLELVCRNRNEALCALAWIDLPEESLGLEISRVDGKLLGKAKVDALLVREAIEPLEVDERAAGETMILVGQEVYEGSSGENANEEVIVDPSGMVRGRVYKARVVATNPSNKRQVARVLVQLPAGSVPLAGDHQTRSVPIDLPAYGTTQVEYSFYFPTAGEFSHYGAQVSESSRLIAAADTRLIKVADQMVVVDDKTWQYVADWGTNEQVMEFLQTTNLDEIDLDRIAFRMANKEAFQALIGQLRELGAYSRSLWAYAVVYNDEKCLSELLSMSPEFVSQLGPAINTPLVASSVEARREFEQLDFRPLVVARSHMLGTERTILNPQLRLQYLDLLELIAHQKNVTQKQHLQLCYYMLLQNRIGEAIKWFDSVDRAAAGASLQIAYFDAYLQFYRGGYDEAYKIAKAYVDYPVTRWRDQFAAIVDQVEARNNLLAGRRVVDDSSAITDRESPTYRGERNDRGASQSASLEMNNADGKIEVLYRQIDEILVNYYEMDIELLFSRRPFVAMNGEQPPAIAPNKSTRIECPPDSDMLVLEIPAELKNRNMIVEIAGGGLSRSTVATAGEMRAEVIEPFGQVRTRHKKDGTPVTAAYVKVYARQPGGKVRFFKDGYTDLRGYFDYASLSTNDLDSVERFAILVLDDALGAVVLEAAPPTR